MVPGWEPLLGTVMVVGVEPVYWVVVTYAGGVCTTTVPGCEPLLAIVNVVGLLPVYWVVVM